MCMYSQCLQYAITTLYEKCVAHDEIWLLKKPPVPGTCAQDKFLEGTRMWLEIVAGNIDFDDAIEATGRRK